MAKEAKARILINKLLEEVAMPRSKFVAIIFLLFSFLTTSITDADDSDLIKISSPTNEGKGIVSFVHRSEILQNLYKYRSKGYFIELTLMHVFLTKKASQKAKEQWNCLPQNPNDYKYMLETIQFRFDCPDAIEKDVRVYDKYWGIICYPGGMSSFPIKGTVIDKALKPLFEKYDRLDKSEP